MLKPVARICLTCQHYEPCGWKCLMDGHYIGYLGSEEKNKCKSYSLSKHYRRGGKFYESRREQDAKAD